MQRFGLNRAQITRSCVSEKPRRLARSPGDGVRQLAITSHYGQPMVGVWDPVGIVVSLVHAVGGVAIGEWGFARRDLRT
jgi:hypothetical protein